MTRMLGATMGDKDAVWIVGTIPLGRPERAFVVKMGRGFVHIQYAAGGPTRKVAVSSVFESFEDAIEGMLARISSQIDVISKQLQAAVHGINHVSHMEPEDDVIPPESIKNIKNVRRWSPEITGSGVYMLCLHGEVVYVGQARNIAERVRTHGSDKFFDSVFFVNAQTAENEMDIMEAVLIAVLNPVISTKSPMSQKQMKHPKVASVVEKLFETEKSA